MLTAGSGAGCCTKQSASCWACIAKVLYVSTVGVPLQVGYADLQQVVCKLLHVGESAAVKLA